MLKGTAKLDVPVYSDVDRDNDQGMDPVMVGIEVRPEDLVQDKSDSSIYRGSLGYPLVDIIVQVQPDGSTTIRTNPPSEIFENTLQV